MDGILRPERPRVRKKSVLYFREIPEAVKLQFKAVCVQRNFSMQDVIQTLMRLYIEHPENFRVRRGRKGRADDADG